MLKGNALTVVRSPAKVCWHIMCEGKFLEASPTKRDAEARLLHYKKILGNAA